MQAVRQYCTAASVPRLFWTASPSPPRAWPAERRRAVACFLLEDLAADYLALTAPHATARRAMPSMQTMLMCFTCRRRRMIGCCLGVLL